MIEIDEAFRRLSSIAFRRKFVLQGRELAYLQTWGIEHVRRQAEEIITKRVAPAQPLHDGRQTPWRNHPVFVAQHATGTCCRGCLEKIHEIPRGHQLTSDELRYVVDVIARWLDRGLA